jgi:phosphatidylserine/phosphatidylglycerophosphate/cardiolipin synthase-like enzyme
MRYIARYLVLGCIATVLMSFVRHGFLNHIFDSTPSFTSMHLPELGKAVSAAIVPQAGTFAYSPDSNIERMDVEAIASTDAHSHLDIAMYAFTDHVIADAVADAAERGIKVRIYRDAQQYEQESGRDQYVARKFAAEPNISICVKHSRELMHLKEWTDGIRLREGSANWSPSGEKRQDNSAAVITNKQASQTFEQKFQDMWDRPDNIRVQ